MPVVKVYTKSQWDEFARSLDALQEKPDSERGVTVREAMKEMRTRIRSAQTKGYTLEQIAEQAKRAGIDVTASTLKYGMRSAGKGNTARQTTKAPTSREVSTPPRGQTLTQGGASRADIARNDMPRHGGKIEAKPSTMPVQAPLSFAIKLDTDDL
jgi:FKBP-type peptidyl-prolyl cis-trans isomerase